MIHYDSTMIQTMIHAMIPSIFISIIDHAQLEESLGQNAPVLPALGIGFADEDLQKALDVNGCERCTP